MPEPDARPPSPADTLLVLLCLALLLVPTFSPVLNAWFVGDELHIGNIAVTKARQGLGMGKQMLEHLLGEASRREVGHATLEVRVSNARAIRLYRRYGFRPIALRKRYYSDNGEDAMVMFAEIGSESKEE